MEYIVLSIVLLAGMFIYFRIAYHFNIVDKPNHRSSHSTVTLRGGGVVWWLAAIVFVAFHPHEFNWYFKIGLTLIALVSFYDDISSARLSVRLLTHLAAMSLIFLMAGVYGALPWWLILMGYVLFVGIINAWNFMDGINGITGLYSLAVLGALQYVNLTQVAFVNPNRIWYPMIASVVFLFFNYRKKARCFAGDVGSVSIAFWTSTLLLLLMIRSGSLIWLGFMMVYGVDTVLTIIHRLYLGQNIFEAHRLHFYQVMANEQKMDHRLVSVIYFVVQLVVSSAIIAFYPIIGWWIFFVTALALSSIYMLKFKLTKTQYATSQQSVIRPDFRKGAGQPSPQNES